MPPTPRRSRIAKRPTELPVNGAGSPDSVLAGFVIALTGVLLRGMVADLGGQQPGLDRAIFNTEDPCVLGPKMF